MDEWNVGVTNKSNEASVEETLRDHDIHSRVDLTARKQHITFSNHDVGLVILKKSGGVVLEGTVTSFRGVNGTDEDFTPSGTLRGDRWTVLFRRPGGWRYREDLDYWEVAKGLFLGQCRELEPRSVSRDAPELAEEG